MRDHGRGGGTVTNDGLSSMMESSDVHRLKEGSEGDGVLEAALEAALSRAAAQAGWSGGPCQQLWRLAAGSSGVHRVSDQMRAFGRARCSSSSMAAHDVSLAAAALVGEAGGKSWASYSWSMASIQPSKPLCTCLGIPASSAGVGCGTGSRGGRPYPSVALLLKAPGKAKDSFAASPLPPAHFLRSCVVGAG